MSKQLTAQKWLPAVKKRVVIYDFDGTLFHSPDRDTGEAAYLKATGQSWPHAGWWGRLETLSPPVVADIPGPEMWVTETLEACRKDALCDQTRLVLMTGRPYKIRRRVEEILGSQGLKFHDYFYRGMRGHRGRDTFEIKCNIIENDLLPGLEVLEIWEDRPEHASGFMTRAKRWRKNLQRVVVHDVPTGMHHEF